MMALLGQLQLRRRVVHDVVLSRHPTEPLAHGHEQGVLRTEAHRLAVLLAVMEEAALIAFEHGPRDLQRLLDAALLQPFQEALQLLAPRPCRGFGEAFDEQRFEILIQQRSEHRLGGRTQTGFVLGRFEIAAQRHCFLLIYIYG